jgi:hypothetical protein
MYFPTRRRPPAYTRVASAYSFSRPASRPTSPSLLGPGLNLGLCALGSLLAYDALGLALGGSGGALGLLRLLLGSSRLLLLLALLDGLGASGRSGLGAHGSLLLDHIERGTDDGSLRLDCSAGSLLGHLLRDTLAVLSSEKNGPGDATGVLALEEKRLRLAILESEDLAVASDVEFTLYLEESRRQPCLRVAPDTRKPLLAACAATRPRDA